MLSRQACAEKIYFDENGHIAQAEVTSCGLNRGPLVAEGAYPARMACETTRNGHNVSSLPAAKAHLYPYFTQDVPDFDPTPETIAQDAVVPFQYVANIRSNSRIGFKYFDYKGNKKLTLRVRGRATGTITIDQGGEAVGTLAFVQNDETWTNVTMDVSFADGVLPLYVNFTGKGAFDLQQIIFA